MCSKYFILLDTIVNFYEERINAMHTVLHTNFSNERVSIHISDKHKAHFAHRGVLFNLSPIKGTRYRIKVGYSNPGHFNLTRDVKNTEICSLYLVIVLKCSQEVA